MATGTCSAMDCLRTPDLIEDDGIVLTIPVSGASILHVRGKEIPIGGNTAALTRTADVCRCEIQSASEVINFRFPFSKIAPLIVDLEAATMRTIPVGTEALRLLAHYAAMLKEDDWITDPPLQSVMASHLQDLAALAIGATRDAAVVAGGRGVPAARLRAIKTDIVRNLTVIFRSTRSPPGTPSRRATSPCCSTAMRPHFRNSCWFSVSIGSTGC
jgi:hypothetical protein